MRKSKWAGSAVVPRKHRNVRKSSVFGLLFGNRSVGGSRLSVDVLGPPAFVDDDPAAAAAAIELLYVDDVGALCP